MIAIAINQGLMDNIRARKKNYIQNYYIGFEDSIDIFQECQSIVAEND